MNHIATAQSLKKPLPATLQTELKSLFGLRFSTAHAMREHHGRDESSYDPMLPDGVVFACSTEEVALIVKLCAREGVPVIPYGTGTSLEGHILALQGGITIDLSQMNAMVAVHQEDLTATVQAGVTRKQLNQELKDTGLFFPIDPGADASLGGMAATRASGTNAVRYGTMRENTLALTVVTADGRIIKTGTRAKKSSAGYDLTRLFVGSEGTLGIITEVTVKLYPQPEAISAAICSFGSIGAAVNAVIETIQMGIPVARVEFLDANGVKAINAHDKLNLPEQPLLLFEFHGSEHGVKEQAEAVQAITTEHGALGFEWATKPEDRTRLWTARHNAYFALLKARPGARAISTDCCVPISRLAECILATRADCEDHKLIYSIIGHVGDGNFHVQMLIDPNDHAEIASAEGVNSRMVTRALGMDGTCTGEHGIGLHKMDFLIEEHGEDAIDIMRTLKHALDPGNIMNPGKIVRW
ncbi:FAD-linked oxidase C-terminal domain-containing protein [Herbaspirillum sp. RTI4]|uniref:FAD-binding oxidoreductase n=1 Tax=Herbaspirillum sp. RTI4 TaxID=3048640 RepID=UPI002AB557D9|nr:FAD-linked oxidase C-terminal domain-containing protein [Herbaspirillum sp. RTI4]MDY7577959.1 FAD-linked oxidase C-terminal domain-containing protein [Herbaspirillum sp. RTI4]MEA9981595.1 FAD-linked oxidase C-terminal domain-containing protein [Herbaspirillum sp. RTI4]